ncbi:hypothetical protein M9Y10_022302 [Tritrichomonas musculus]|uniref:F5/8 type C domain-containing protein n=1 Tax=Tritrichomonas musculus TaxID=1915356 RepID=A0ABR2KRV6_9EUKA
MNFDEESQTLFLTHQGLKNLSLLNLENNFTIKIGIKSYECNRVLASFISPVISQILSSDPLCNTFTIDVEDNQNLFDNIMALMNGDTIEINASNYDLLLLIASKLGNQEMQDDLSLMSFSENHVTFHNAIRRFISKSSLGISVEGESKFIASHFSEYAFDELNKLDDYNLDLILSQNNLKIEDESWLFNFLMRRNPPSPSLFSHLYFEYLTEKDIEKFLKFLKEEEMTGPLWAAISRRLVLHVDAPFDMSSRHCGKVQNDDDEYDNVSINFSEDYPFEGIISFLTDKYGGNVSITKAVAISSSGTLWNSPSVIADFDSTDFWVSENLPDSWIAYDFKERLINITAYTIRGDNTGSLCNWVVEGSIDKILWDELDRHENCSDLIGLYTSKSYFVDSRQEYRYIRLRQIGPDISNENYLNLCCFEVFGSLSTNYDF